MNWLSETLDSFGYALDQVSFVVFRFVVRFRLWVQVRVWVRGLVRVAIIGIQVQVWVRVWVRDLARVTIIRIFLGFLGHIFNVTTGGHRTRLIQLQWVAIPMSKQGIIDWGELWACLAWTVGVSLLLRVWAQVVAVIECQVCRIWNTVSRVGFWGDQQCWSPLCNDNLSRRDGNEDNPTSQSAKQLGSVSKGMWIIVKPKVCFFNRFRTNVNKGMCETIQYSFWNTGSTNKGILTICANELKM